MTVLYYAFFSGTMSEALFIERLNTVPMVFKKRIQKFMRQQDACASLIGKLLLMRGFRDFGLPDDLLDLQLGKYGKPYLPNHPIGFNISHSGNCIVCIVTDESCSLGVDVEEIKPIAVVDLPSVWTPEEWKDIETGSLDVFYEYWTRKEAIIKLDGRGISIPLDTIDVRKQEIIFDNKVCFLRSIDIGKDYKLNLASFKMINEVVKIKVDYDK